MLIVHNTRGFDSYIVLSYLVGDGMTPSLIMPGSKMMFHRIKFPSQIHRFAS